MALLFPKTFVMNGNLLLLEGLHLKERRWNGGLSLGGCREMEECRRHPALTALAAFSGLLHLCVVSLLLLIPSAVPQLASPSYFKMLLP